METQSAYYYSVREVHTGHQNCRFPVLTAVAIATCVVMVTIRRAGALCVPAPDSDGRWRSVSKRVGLAVMCESEMIYAGADVLRRWRHRSAPADAHQSSTAVDRQDHPRRCSSSVHYNRQ